MINEQAIDTMTQMLALISKHGKKADTEVETDASREHRRRAWVVTCLLAKFAGHAAKSDLHCLFADDTSETYTARQNYYRAARQEDRDFMRELCAFKKQAEEFENEPVTGDSRTDNDIVLNLELHLQEVENLQWMHKNYVEVASKKVPKEHPALLEAKRNETEEQLANTKQQLDALQKLALSRGMVVSSNRYRTVIKRVPKPIAKAVVAAATIKKTSAHKRVATGATQKPKTKAAHR